MRMLILILTLSVGAPLLAQSPVTQVPAVAVPQPPAAPPVDAPSLDYVLDVGDILRINVENEADLSGTQFRVDTDGAFPYKYLGRVQARGRTTRALIEEITTGLSNGYVRRPVVTVEIEQYRPRSVHIVGEVRTPGPQPMQGTMTLLEGLAKAGYVTQAAGTEVLILRRQAGAGGQEAQRQIRVSLLDLQTGKLEANVALEDGDVVNVLRAEKFYVQGQVKSPGEFVWEPKLTVRAAIIKAGGIGDKGSTRRIRIIRLVPDGNRMVEKRIDVDQTDVVQAGDVIDVGQRLL